MTIEVREDSHVRGYLARVIALRMLHSWRFHAMFLLLGTALAIWGVIGWVRGVPSPTRPDIFPFSIAISLLGVAFSGITYALYRLLPAQRWTFESERIRMRGRELGSVKYKQLDSFAIEPVPELPGYTLLAVYRANGVSHWLVAAPSSPVSAIDAELAERLGR